MKPPDFDMIMEPRKSSPSALAPDEALAAIRGHTGPSIVDLDETLYLRNSTEDYIDSVMPRTPALIALRVLGIIKPWRWSGGATTEDMWRVWLLTLLFPWTYIIWRKRARRLGQQYANKALMDVLAGRRFTIATLGFGPIVRPLIEAMGLRDATIVACRLTAPSDRICGKLALLKQKALASDLRATLVVTDSIQDMDLLNACGTPVLTNWPNAQYRRALRDVYLPGEYLETVRRPAGGTGVKIIVTEDFSLWLFATFPAVFASAWNLLGLIFLFISFWAIYESGYIENDLVAQKYEADPQLSHRHGEFDSQKVGIGPWLHAILFGMLGVAILAPPGARSASCGLWLSMLALTRLSYRIYNYSDKGTRVWLYLILQVLRYCAFVAVLPMNLIGGLASAAIITTRWQAYFIYRQFRPNGVREWPALPFKLIRFALLSTFMAVAFFVMGRNGFGDVKYLWPLAAAVWLWNMFLARKEIAVAAKVYSRLKVA